MQRVDTVGVLKTEDGNQRREKKRWMEADVSKGNSHAGKPSQLQNKLHVKVNELLRQLQQGDQQLKDLWKVNDSLTEEIALKKKTLKKKRAKNLQGSELGFSRAARLGRRSRRALQEKNLERNWLTKEEDAGKRTEKKQMKKKKGSVEGCNRTCGANRAAEICISSQRKKGSEYNEA